MGGGGDQKTVTKSVNEPFPGQQPYLINLYDLAKRRSTQPLHYYPWDTVTDRQPWTQAGLENMVTQGSAVSPYREGVGALAEKTFRGDFLSPESNPYLKSTFDMGARSMTDAYQRAVMPGIASRYAQAGRVGSPEQMRAEGIAQEELGQGLGDLATTIYGGAYGDERNRQMMMAQMAPSLEEARFAGPRALTEAGMMQEDYAQRKLDDYVNRYEFNRDEVDLRLARLAGLLGNPITGSGVQSSRTSGGGGNILSQGLMAGAAVGRMLPWRM